MSNYELYEKVLSALDKDTGSLTAAVRNWMADAEDPHFESEEANELFYKGKYYFNKWDKGTIDARISKIRMVNVIRELAEMHLPNPYKKEEPEVEPVIELEIEPEAKPVVEAVSETEVEPKEAPEEIKAEEPVKEITHVMGVVPEEKGRIFNRRKKR